MNRLHLPETDSVLNAIRQMPEGGRLALTADFQTAGRGSTTLEGTTNHWEAERGKNLLLAVRFPTPPVKADETFRLSEACAVATLRGVREVLPEAARSGCRVKWPNDLYHADSKVAGMLLEHVWQGGKPVTSYWGVGVNVNQRDFRSGAPNPLSLCRIAGREIAVQDVLNAVLHHLDALLDALGGTDFENSARDFENSARELKISPRELKISPRDFKNSARDFSACAVWDALHREYLQNLYRREGEHAFRDVAGRHHAPQTAFRATIGDVQSDGTLILYTPDGERLPFCFKEIAFLPETAPGNGQ